MKNEQYILGEEIPRELRLSLYKEALEYYKLWRSGKKAKIAHESDFLGLCLLLPVLLWGLESFLSNPPTNEGWNYLDTPQSFPEIQDLVDQIYASKPRNIARLQLRINGLTKIIAEMETS